MNRLALILIALSLAWQSPAQVVNVTAAFDATNLTVGATTTLRVFGQVSESWRPQADQILTWYVDLVNLTPATARVDFSTLQKSASDRDSRTSSGGRPEGVNNLRGIFDTFLNTSGVGITNPVELLSCSVTFLSTGRVAFAVSPGTGVTNLAADFLVNPIGEGDLLKGGIYSSARAELVVNPAVTNVAAAKLTVAYFKTGGLSPNRATLSFNPVAGNNYFIEYLDQFSKSNSWQTLPGAPQNSGLYVDTNSVPSRFYRLRVVSGAVILPAVKLQITHSKLAAGSANRVALSFNTVSGPNYYLEYRDAVTPGSAWQPMPGAPHNSGSYLDTNSVPTRFYRVRVTQ